MNVEMAHIVAYLNAGITLVVTVWHTPSLPGDVPGNNSLFLGNIFRQYGLTSYKASLFARN